jgi:transposase InsO family protein
MVSRRKSYTREFKIETVKLVTDGDAKVPEIARDLGIHPNTLYNWIQQFSAKPEEAFPGKGYVASDAEVIRQLKRENERLTRTLVINAFTMAVKRRNPPRGLLHHSDRGSQYASGDFQRLLAKYGAICSMSRKGNCWDNAVVESFFGFLKREHVFHNRYLTRAQARQSIFDYIERFYNRKRIHSSLGYKTPSEVDQLKLAA